MNYSRLKVFASAPVLCGLIVFFVYYLTLAPTVAWGNFPDDILRVSHITPQTILSEDSAELSGAAATLGIAHPPGYPLFIMAGHLFTWLPLGKEAAYRTNLFSAVCAAVTVALLWVIVRDWTERPRAAWLAALLFAFSYTFWEHAVMTEVHALHTLLLTLALWFALRAVRTNERRWLYGWAFVLGLGMTNHLTTVLLLPGFLVLLIHPLHQTARDRRTMTAIVGCFIAGLLPYLYLPLRAAQHPPYNWGDPSSLGRFWAHVSGAQYRHFLMKDGWERVLAGLVLFPIQLMVEFRYLPMALGVFGFGWGLWQWWSGTRDAGQRRRNTQHATRNTSLIPHPSSLISLLLMGVAQFAYVLCYHIPDPQALYIPVYLVFAIGIGIGWAAVDRSWDSAGSLWRGLSRVILIGLIAIPLLQEEPHVHGFLSGIEHFLPPRSQGLLLQHPRVSLRQHYMAARFAQGVLKRLPRDTIYLSRGDGQTFAVWYYQRVQRQRPDVVTVLTPMLSYAWYREEVAGRLPVLSSLGSHPTVESIVALLTRDPKTQHRPIFFNVMPRSDKNLLAAVPVPLPSVGPADKATDDQALLYRYAPQGTAGREVETN